MNQQQKSMRVNYGRPLVNWKSLALVVLGFVLYPALTVFPRPFLRRQAPGGKISLYNSQQQQRELFCNDTLLFLRRTEISHEIVQTLELHRLGNCGDVRQPARNRKGSADYVPQDPGFVLPEQLPPYRGATPQQILTDRIPETTIGRGLRALPTE